MSCPTSTLNHRRDRGFTVIEMMITVLIIGVLTVAALPSFRDFVAGQRIKSAAFDMMAMLNLARSEAIKRNLQVTAAPGSPDWAQGWTVSDTTNGITISRQSALNGMTVNCFTGSPGALTAAACNTSIVYSANGRVSSGAQFIQLNSNASYRCIGIDLSGRPNSKKGACA